VHVHLYAFDLSKVHFAKKAVPTMGYAKIMISIRGAYDGCPDFVYIATSTDSHCNIMLHDV